MRTRFSVAQLADPDLREANAILRACVHCGFCLASCPTYGLLGDELDSPRGRIYLAKEMLENGRPATAEVVKHIDRCLSCLSCMTTCPSGVDYGHLVERARVHIEKTYRRPAPERWLRTLLAVVVPRPRLFRLAALAGHLARPLARLAPGRLKGMVAMAPGRLAGPSWADRHRVFQAVGARRSRVALFGGCAQQVLRPEINEATVRVLTRHGVEVVVARGTGCCGAIVHHLGGEQGAKAAARANIAAWWREIEGEGLDGVVFNASGCGVQIKDYGHLLRNDPDWSARAAQIAELARDISEVLVTVGLRQPEIETGQKVAYHMACTMQHGLGLRAPAKHLLACAGFHVIEPLNAHICCGSAGSYSILQPDLAGRLRQRKIATLHATAAEIIATGNIGCLHHLGSATHIPIVHTVELLDWATGGPKPAGIP
jgi:glycolate oxidase iron-sulfur subunit